MSDSSFGNLNVGYLCAKLLSFSAPTVCFSAKVVTAQGPNCPATLFREQAWLEEERHRCLES